MIIYGMRDKWIFSNRTEYMYFVAILRLPRSFVEPTTPPEVKTYLCVNKMLKLCKHTAFICVTFHFSHVQITSNNIQSYTNPSIHSSINFAFYRLLCMCLRPFIAAKNFERSNFYFQCSFYKTPWTRHEESISLRISVIPIRICLCLMLNLTSAPRSDRRCASKH